MSTLTPRAMRHYRAMRREGFPAGQAFLIARGEDRTRAWEHEHVMGTVDMSDGWGLQVDLAGTEYLVEIHYDETYDLDDPETYTDEDRESRYRGDWATYWVRVHTEIDGIDGEDVLGGIDAGYWSTTDLDVDQQILDVALEHGMFDAARTEAVKLNAAPGL